MSSTRFDDEEVSEVYASQFGAQLFNLYTFHRGPEGNRFASQRIDITRRMLRAMLDGELEIDARRDACEPSA
jgi:hypothetical protein